MIYFFKAASTNTSQTTTLDSSSKSTNEVFLVRIGFLQMRIKTKNVSFRNGGEWGNALPFHDSKVTKTIMIIVLPFIFFTFWCFTSETVTERREMMTEEPL